MLYCVSREEYPVKYASSGNLISENGFVHDRRNLDTWVFIMICHGTLHIAQNERKFDIHENETFLLFPHQTHYGYKKSEGPLSYYWVHFYLTDPDYTIYNRNTLIRHNRFLQDNNDPQNIVPSIDHLILPEYGKISSEKRSLLLFSQLLDISKRDNYKQTWRCHYALNLLLSEFTIEFMSQQDIFDNQLPSNVKAIIEWIRVHYEQPITVASIAEHFHYHPTYMSALFKQYTGHTVSYYITFYRIAAAKNLLTAPPPKSVSNVWLTCAASKMKNIFSVSSKKP
jgi:hypothetical protein